MCRILAPKQTDQTGPRVTSSWTVLSFLFSLCYQKSLPAVRRLTADPHLFIQQASTSTGNLTKPPSSTTTGQPFSTSQQVNKRQGHGIKVCTLTQRPHRLSSVPY